jgi:hypothetical protein
MSLAAFKGFAQCDGTQSYVFVRRGTNHARHKFADAAGTRPQVAQKCRCPNRDAVTKHHIVRRHHARGAMLGRLLFQMLVRLTFSRYAYIQSCSHLLGSISTGTSMRWFTEILDPCLCCQHARLVSNGTHESVENPDLTRAPPQLEYCR